jgi:hypothetical protein
VYSTAKVFVVISGLNITRSFVVRNLSYCIIVTTNIVNNNNNNNTIQDITSDGWQMDKKGSKESLASALRVGLLFWLK